MAAGKVWDAGLCKWVKEDELTKEQGSFADLANFIGEEIAKRGMTREGVRELFDCVQRHLLFSDFEPLIKRGEAPTPESSEPRAD